jgi:hypothetical protein
MPRYTDRWGLSILGSGDSLQANGFKFSDADRRLIDRLLSYAAEGHHHTGTRGDDLTPDAPLTLTLSTTGGTISSGSRYYYRFTVLDEFDNESAPSPISYIDTPSTVATPSAPAISYTAGTGGLQPGGYSYVLSAYKGATTQETKATNTAFVTISGALPTNQVTLTLPAMPAGADGCNVYRKSPSGMHYLWITNVVAPAPLELWVDDGSISGDCDRSLPATNRTGGTNAINVAVPGATPSVPDGWTWRVYRTVDPNRWGRSWLKDVTPIGDPPETPIGFNDTGLSTEVGGPPVKAQIINAPAKINLTDAAEVQGSLPPGLLVAPQMLTFVQPGPIEAGDGTFIWVCDFDQADVKLVRIYLGPDATPAADDLIVDVKALRPSKGSATWISLFAPEEEPPTLPVGENTITPLVPVRQHLERGDALSVDILQAGGGATPTDFDLSVNMLLYVKDGSETLSYAWADT